jgi:putative ABC transport system substrate-binding protein
MRRREFITLLGSAAAWPLAAHAQQPGRMRLIGVLVGYAESDPAAQSYVAAFRGALDKLGWTEGNSLRIELRWSTGDANRIRTFAKELVDLRPDVILSITTPATAAVQRETQTIQSFLRLSGILWAMVLWRACRVPAGISLAS